MYDEEAPSVPQVLKYLSMWEKQEIGAARYAEEHGIWRLINPSEPSRGTWREFIERVSDEIKARKEKKPTTRGIKMDVLSEEGGLLELMEEAGVWRGE